MKYALLNYKNYASNTLNINIGDYIQSLAAKQYLPKVDVLIDREKMKEYDGPQVRIIMNGWYMHHPQNWPPSNKINPLFVSFHISPGVKDKMLLKEGVEYLKKHTPIGCRDYYTLGELQKYNIDSYYSGCLTLTLDKMYKDLEKTDDIYFVDVLFNYPSFNKLVQSPRLFLDDILNANFKYSRKKTLNQIFDQEILSKAQYLTHVMPKSMPDKERFEYAAVLLQKYAKAKLVVTSRIHCALPCLALGTPVVFINGYFSKDWDKHRIESFDSLFNMVTVSQDDISSNFPLTDINTLSKNPDGYQSYSKALKEKCENFINLSGE